MKPNFKVLATSALIALPLPSFAQSADGEWEFVVAPYLWATGLNGTMATIPGVPPADVDASFSDILSNLDAAALVVLHANNGRFGISGDLQYYKISAGITSGGPVGASSDLLVRETIATVLGDYLLTSGPGYELWGQAGLRYWEVESEVNITAGGGTRTSAGSSDWVDPVIGVRGNKQLGENSYLTGWALFGGFGGGSDEMYDVFGGYGYQFTETTAAVIGYHYLSVDRSDGEFLFDAVQKGPIVGVRFKF
ncbi:MAG: hypothetical protein ACU0BB_06815 [Paracoccaceae bacterium]